MHEDEARLLEFSHHPWGGPGPGLSDGMRERCGAVIAKRFEQADQERASRFQGVVGGGQQARRGSAGVGVTAYDPGRT